MNEEVAQESIRFAANTTKVSVRFLINALKAYLAHREKVKNTPIKGKQTVKQLVQQNQGVTSLEVSGESMSTFKKIAGKYGVDFAIVKDKSTGKDNPRYTVFFKARDTDAIQAVLNEYTAKIVKKARERDRPSTLEKLKKLKAIIAGMPRKPAEKKKENVR